jgi:hypothetical protein
MRIIDQIGKLFGADAPAPADATKLDGTTEAALARSLSALSPDERGWITFAEARNLFSAEHAEYAFGETDEDGRKNIDRGAAQGRHQLHAGRGARLFRAELEGIPRPLFYASTAITVAKLLTKAEARRIAANIVKLLDLLRKP